MADPFTCHVSRQMRCSFQWSTCVAYQPAMRTFISSVGGEKRHGQFRGGSCASKRRGVDTVPEAWLVLPATLTSSLNKEREEDSEI